MENDDSARIALHGSGGPAPLFPAPSVLSTAARRRHCTPRVRRGLSRSGLRIAAAALPPEAITSRGPLFASRFTTRTGMRDTRPCAQLTLPSVRPLFPCLASHRPVGTGEPGEQGACVRGRAAVPGPLV